jgi:hypothetical protein
MNTIQMITRQINKELVPVFEERLRSYLVTQDKEWLIEQIVRLTLDAHSLHEMDRKRFQAEKEQQRTERLQRLQQMALDPAILTQFLETYRTYDRDKLIEQDYLSEAVPAKGTDLITDVFRTPKGAQLLTQAKDLLFGLLFGEETTNTYLHRREREILTLVMPRFKAAALDFMKATTELSALGTWQDPESMSNDQRAENVILEVEFGEVEGELIGAGIVRTLSLINNLEINEQILYARMINVEQSTLIE